MTGSNDNNLTIHYLGISGKALYTRNASLHVHYLHPAESIRFEIWGVVEPGKKFRFFSGNFTKKKIDFPGQIFQKKFRFFLGNLTKKIDFSREISEELRFLRQFHRKFRFPRKF